MRTKTFRELLFISMGVNWSTKMWIHCGASSVRVAKKLARDLELLFLEWCQANLRNRSEPSRDHRVLQVCSQPLAKEARQA